MTAQLLAVLLLLTETGARTQSSDWAQWGGPQRNFKSDTKGLAAEWPVTGPRRLWQRELGEGYSAIAAESGKLFTMYRKGEHEIVIALDAATGKPCGNMPMLHRSHLNTICQMAPALMQRRWSLVIQFSLPARRGSCIALTRRLAS
jgi:hypothetical protein